MSAAPVSRQGRSTPTRIAIKVPSLPASVPQLRREATAFARANGASEQLALDIALVVSEAVTNAVKYAYDSDRRGEVELLAEVADGFLEIAVRDTGAGFGSGSSDGLGLGLSIIARLSAEMTVVQAGDGTEVRMRFALSGGG